MADDLKRKGPEDPTKVNVDEPWELKYWSEKFGVSSAKLKRAVVAVGPSVAKVKAWLEKN